MHTIGITFLGYILLTSLFPLVVHRITTGRWPLAFHRTGDSLQKLIGLQLSAALALGAVWAVALDNVPSESLHLVDLPLWLRGVGWPILFLGALVEIFSQLYMGTSFRMGLDPEPTELLTRGPYALVRNPVYTGLILSVTGIVLLTPSPYTIMGALWMLSLVAIQTRLEENHMLTQHKETYRVYASRTGRFFPLVGCLK